MNRLALITLAVSFGLLSACASTPSSSSAQSQAPSPSSGGVPGTQSVKSKDGSFVGEVTGQPRTGSPFAKLQIGMHMDEIQETMGRAPDRFHTYETGKRWIPLYFGNDARRMQVLYKGEGCLIVTGGNIWGGAGGDLIAIHHDATGGCYQP